jgi:NitT/TauT family transport system substrate-binding protein
MKVRAGLVMVLALLLAGCGGGGDGDAGGGGGGGSQAPAGPTKITVASAPNVFLTGMYIARDRGIFQKEGLEVEIVEVEAGTDSVAALVSGNAQFADIGLDDLANLAGEGEEGLVMTHNILSRVTLTLVMRADVARQRGVTRQSPLPQRYAALKGLTIGITSPGAPTDNYMRYYLRQAGLDPDRDAEIVALGGGSNLLAALEENKIQAYHLSPPTPYVAEAEGFGVVLIDGPAGDVQEFSNFLYTGWATNREWAADNPEQAKAFSRALKAAMEAVKADPAAAAKEVADDVGTQDVAQVERTLNAFLPALSVDGCFTDQTVTASLGTMKQVGLLEGEADPKAGGLWTNDYNGC